MMAAAGSGPAATSFFLRGSTTRFNPSSVRAPRRSKSPFSAKTTSSTVKNLSKRMIAKSTLRVTCCPLAIVNNRSFFSRLIPIFSSVMAGTQVYSLPVSTNIRDTITDLVRSTTFSTLQRVKKVPIGFTVHERQYRQSPHRETLALVSVHRSLRSTHRDTERLDTPTYRETRSQTRRD